MEVLPLTLCSYCLRMPSNKIGSPHTAIRSTFRSSSFSRRSRLTATSTQVGQVPAVQRWLPGQVGLSMDVAPPILVQLATPSGDALL